MKIFNTLSRRKEEFVPIEPGKVKMYVCGPTVYNFIHIGNARPMIVFDTVRRYFEYKGYEVNYVSNFTDVTFRAIWRSDRRKSCANLRKLERQTLSCLFEILENVKILPRIRSAAAVSPFDKNS